MFMWCVKSASSITKCIYHILPGVFVRYCRMYFFDCESFFSWVSATMCSTFTWCVKSAFCINLQRQNCILQRGALCVCAKFASNHPKNKICICSNVFFKIDKCIWQNWILQRGADCVCVRRLQMQLVFNRLNCIFPNGKICICSNVQMGVCRRG